MNTQELTKRLMKSLDDMASLAGDHLPQERDGKPNEEMVLLIAALSNVELRVKGITETRMEAVEKSQQYRNMPVAIKKFDRTGGYYDLFVVEIGEFEGDEWETPAKLYKVLMAAETPEIAGNEAQVFCADEFGIPVKLQNVLKVTMVEAGDIQKLKNQVW